MGCSLINRIIVYLFFIRKAIARKILYVKWFAYTAAVTMRKVLIN